MERREGKEKMGEWRRNREKEIELRETKYGCQNIEFCPV